MWPRLSLRVQILVILLFVLGAEAALSSGWLALVVRRTLAAEDGRIAGLFLSEHLDHLAARCAHAGALQPDCARAALQELVDRRLVLGARLGAVEVGARTGGIPVAVERGPLRLAARLPLDPERARAAQLFQFHLVNLGVAVVGLALLGAFLFGRAVVRPVEKLSAVADRIGHLELAELSSDIDAPMLGQLTSSFERMARALRREQERVLRQVEELTRANRELKEARDAIVRQEKLATVGRLAAGVAHEVGNPLGGILGYAELLKARTDPVAREYGERIEKEVARIDRTVRGLLDFSRPSQTELAPITLASSVQRALALCQADKRFREVESRVALPEGLPPVLADEHRLGQVLVNLLLNAGDAMQGKGLVTVSARLADDLQPHRRASDPPPGRLVELAVEDTGPGIPPEVLPRIFDPFFTTKEVGQGTGLGLSICASIMDAFGGELRAENRPEGGARFIVTLRAAPPK